MLFATSYYNATLENRSRQGLLMLERVEEGEEEAAAYHHRAVRKRESLMAT